MSDVLAQLPALLHGTGGLLAAYAAVEVPLLAGLIRARSPLRGIVCSPLLAVPLTIAAGVGIAALSPLLAAKASFLALVPEPAAEALAEPRLVQLGPLFRDFADTAACLEEIDLVITSDTALAHLAGALGRPTFLLLHHAPDWRWLEARPDSPWYPSMRLFRQPKPKDWNAVVNAVQNVLCA